MYFNLGGSA